MREHVFVEKYASEWKNFDDYLQYKKASVKQRRKKNLLQPLLDDEDYPAAYRRLCNQLALAKTRCFSQHVIARLNELVAEGHNYLYRRRSMNLSAVYQFILYDFPIAIRREKKVMFWGALCFLLPALVTFILVQWFPSAAYSFIDESALRKMESMYSSDERIFDGGRSAKSDVVMFGIYIWNNISIALRSFASGLLLGVGSMFISAFNGMYLGVVFSHIQNEGYAVKNLYPFVITHGAFEITALIIAGGAGLRLGLSLLLPGRYTRMQSIAKASQSLTPIVIGFVIMLVIAALIEAFWSAADFPNRVKFITGSLCWLLVIFYFVKVGRGHES